MNHYKIETLFFLCVFSFLSLPLFAEETSQKNAIVELSTAMKNDVDEGINTAKTLLKNNSVGVRREVLTWLMSEANSLYSTPLDTELSKLLIKEYLVKESETLLLAYEWLLQLSYKVNLTDVSNGFLPMLNNKYLSHEDIVLLGVFEVDGFKPILDELFAATQKGATDSKQKTSSNASWAILIMQARYGNKDAIKRVLSELESNYDDIIRVTQRFKDLKLIPNHEVRDYLLNYLFSEKRLPRIKDNVPGSLYATYAAQALAVVDKNFPIKKERFKEADIIKIRQWYEQHNS